jgi:hypothetical protein
MDIVFATDTPFVWKAEKELRENRDALVNKAKDANELERQKYHRNVGVDTGNAVDDEKQNGNGWIDHKENA